MGSEARKMSGEGLRRLIKEFEGHKNKAYRNFPNEPWTIGYGATKWLDGKAVHPEQTCTEQEAEALLARDIRDTEKAVDRYLLKEVNITDATGKVQRVNRFAVPPALSLNNLQASAAS